jgi:hypothetical protein
MTYGSLFLLLAGGCDSTPGQEDASAPAGNDAATVSRRDGASYSQSDSAVVTTSDAATMDAAAMIGGDGGTSTPHDAARADRPALADGGTPAALRDASIPHLPLLKSGLHPAASDALRFIGVTAGQITQTIGGAVASAGTHLQDGTVGGQPYGAATDFSVRGMTQAEIKTFLGKLHFVGFAAWYRWPGHDGWPASEVPHIHAVHAGCAMKPALDAQMRDFFVGKNGLASHTEYTFFKADPDDIAEIKKLFDRFN